MTAKKDLKQLQKEFERRGWTVKRTRGDHLEWTHAASGQRHISASTPGGGRSVKNTTADLNRIERDYAASMEKSAMPNTAPAGSPTVFNANVSWYRVGRDYGVVITVPTDAVPIALRDKSWRASFDGKTIALHQSSEGGPIFAARTANLLLLKFMWNKIANWPFGHVAQSFPAEVCHAIRASAPNGRSFYRIAVPQWVLGRQAALNKEDAQREAEPAVTAPAEQSATQCAPLALPAGLNFVDPPGKTRGRIAVKKTARTVALPSTSPVPETMPAAPPVDRTWADATGLCDMVNEFVETTPGVVEFFMHEGQLAVRVIREQVYLPKVKP